MLSTVFAGERAVFESLPDGRIKLTKPLHYAVWLQDGVRFRVTVPTGFVSDGASIPRPLWSFIGPPIGSSHLLPAVVHDYLCEQAATYSERVLGDAVFFALLKRHNVPYWKRAAMYLAVRLYGRFIWKKGRANEFWS